MNRTKVHHEEHRDERRGLRGAKAFFVVLGTGMLAALLVFAVAVGVVRGFGEALTGSSSSGKENEGVAPERGTVEEMKVGALDLCTALEQEGLQGDLPERQDADNEYVDTGSEDSSKKVQKRTVSDSCSWTIEPEYKNILNVELNYKAYVSGNESDSKISLAEQDFQQRKSKMKSEFEEYSSSGELEGFGDESHYMFGETTSDDRQFLVSGRGKSGVLSLVFREIDRGELSDQDLKNQLQKKSMKVAPRLFERFDRLLPD